MTENKRFTLSQNGTFHTVRDNVENKPLGVFEFKDDEFPVYACFHRIIDLMNNLSDENEQLKTQLQNTSAQRDEFHRGVRENANRVGKLKKENEQLKNELRIYRELANCSNCQYHNHDTLFGGDDEYEVCDKGNDVTDGICKDWREL